MLTGQPVIKERLVKELSGAAHERTACLVFFVARALSDDDQRRGR